ncbi:UDP-3-O-(3-hydroxymyristoyl)glucosamine N-acyltransferase [Cysteiniphilum sp. QT6929]|uniref:UDP-3-O-(3-hydroxymyristoyl)glucosamine N-acyltransferase n=1 Tax=Cysteiniphilum sp. QT6929 TaxID=2975055 RepID=UPI0024B34B1B|nr:UDP-3-O-(3-hydroxymyristoyl)glucosamine N-acyltransferase [Cysteiniphilum sp. QT6929]WHN65287.1 UDP-3-O-(3-hydroxymyristoyl)glucosamine N-acyltransferase [Cysteiniphilum sp. QT6929]
MYSLKTLAEDLGGYVHGDESIVVDRLATLKGAKSGQLSFLANSKYINDLKDTKASAVLLTKEALELCPTNAVVLDNPYLAFAKVAALFDRAPKARSGIHPSATIASSAKIAANASIAANVVIGENVIIAENAIIGANCVILDNSSIGTKTEIKPNVTIYHGVHIGEYCIIHANTVIGSDGFGNAKDEKGNWVKIPQIGGVTIGNHVEIGACTSIDRGAIDDTIIADGVKIDNQVQIAHNVIIGENTAIAGSTGVAGSVTIGKNCLLGGQVGVSGHLEICDGVLLAAASNVSKSITEPGFYTAAFNARPHMEWKRTSARIFRLDKLETRVKMLEQKCKDSE